MIIFTSGTTGDPRGVVYPQRYLTGQALQAEHWFGAGEGDLAWCTAAPGWSKSTRNVFIAAWLRGAAAVIHDGRFDPERALASWSSARGSASSARPRPSTGCSPSAPSCTRSPALRRMVSAGEPLNPEVIAHLPRARRAAASATATARPRPGPVTGMRPGDEDPAKDGSMGRPLPGIEARVPARTASWPPGGAAGPPRLGADLLQPLPRRRSRSRGEWWPTGDQVREDEDGYLWFEGRDDDIIVTAGYRVGPFEVESALVSHPAVAEAAAVAAPDEERGSVVRAVVVLREGEPSEALATELQDHVKAVTAPYKYPRIVEFADELPKTSSGKIRRAELRGG